MDGFKPCRFLAWSKPVRSRRSASFSLIIFATALLALSGCNRTGEESGACPIAYNTSGLPNVTLTDQYGQHVLLSSLRGKPVLFDFIYTSCPGPCQLLTQHMKLIADQLGPALGPKVSFVSVTVDPEHDRLCESIQCQSEGLVFPHRFARADRRVDATVPFGAFTRWRRRDRSRFGIFSGRPRRPSDS
jgi:cytochrome oxidase Cu insertion factor (SCO1/SenC/PrrC family)